MKKIIYIIVACLLAAGLITGIVLIATSCSQGEDEGYSSNIELLQDEYKSGSAILYRFYAFSDRQFDKLTYSINNGSEVDVYDAIVGEGDDHEEDNDGYDFYIDSRPQIIDSNTLGPGHFTITFYGYCGPEKIELCDRAYQFKIYMPVEG